MMMKQPGPYVLCKFQRLNHVGMIINEYKLWVFVNSASVRRI